MNRQVQATTDLKTLGALGKMLDYFLKHAFSCTH